MITYKYIKSRKEINMIANLKLYNIQTNKEMELDLPVFPLQDALGDFCSVEELHNQVLTLEIESGIGFEDDEFVDIDLLNHTLLEIFSLEPRDMLKWTKIWDIQEEKNLYTLVNVLRFFDNYEIIDKTQTDKRTIANLVSYALFGCDLAWELESQLSYNNINALIHVGLKSGILKETQNDFYIYDNDVLQKNTIQSAEILEILPYQRQVK